MRGLIILFCILSQSVFAQYTVRSKIVDNNKFEAGITIYEQGNTQNGTITDTNGIFELIVSNEKTVVIISRCSEPITIEAGKVKEVIDLSGKKRRKKHRSKYTKID